MKLFRTFAVLLSVAALTACEKNAVQDLTGPLPSARIKFYNFGVNAPAVNFYANDRKMTAISSTTGTESNLGTAYGGVGSGDRYAAIDPGQYTFSGRIAAAVDKDLPISTVPGTIGDGKRYSYYVSGFYNTTSKSADGFIVEDNFPEAFDYSVALVRFVNAISNSNPMTLYLRNTDTGEEIAVGGAVAYKSAGAFTPVPNALYDLRTRYAGSSSNVVVRTGVTFSTGRVYTIGARGDMTVTSTTATNRPFLDNTTNR